MVIVINGQPWSVVLVPSSNINLMRSDGTYALGMTDNTTHRIYITNKARPQLRKKILCHEIVHAYCFSHDIHMDIDTEEIVADFVATHGQNILDLMHGIIVERLAL